MRGRFWASTAAFTALFATSFGACDPGFTIDPAGYCLDEPQDPRCPPPSAGTGGSGGTAGSLQGNAGMASSGSSGSSGSGGVGGGGSAGAPPTCTAPQIDCSGTCVDVTQDDAQNCGACGYACESGRACAQGTCAPLSVVEGVVAPYALAVDDTFVYFAVPVLNAVGGGKLPVQRVARAGGVAAAVPFAGDPTFRSRSLALEGGILYFGDLDGSALRKGPAIGGDAVLHQGAQPAVQQLTSADGALWWSLFDGGTSRLRRMSNGVGGAGGGGAGGTGGGGAGGAAGVEDLLPGPSLVHFGRVPSLSIEGGVIYWLNASGSVSTHNGLWRKAEGADAEQLLASEGLVAVTVGPDSLYVADETTGIRRGAKTAPTSLTELISPSAVGGSPQGLAVVGGKLYWLAVTMGGQLELHRAALDGTEARVLGRVQTKQPDYWTKPIGPSQLLSDGSFVYFADPGTLAGGDPQDNNLSGVTGAADGAIYRLPQ